MKTNLHPIFEGTADGQTAAAILRNCVHCGFCIATCPTYQEVQDERDGPRGRIYLMKELFEEASVTAKTRTHLDRCLTCRSCETTCPSGVEYGKLLDIGRGYIEQNLSRSLPQRVVRRALRLLLPYPRRFGFLLALGQFFRPLLPPPLRQKIPRKRTASAWPTGKHNRTMLALEGCAQSVATPNTNAATARVLDALGITLLTAPAAGCCGAVDYHLGAHNQGLAFMRKNIDAWWPAIEAGAEAIMTAASGCGVQLKEYGYLLRNDADYAVKAAQVSALTRDISEILLAEDLSVLQHKESTKRIALHCPCTLQHGQQLPDTVATVLRNFGFDLTRTKDQHLCCGSAGTYSILQPKMSQKLLANKLAALSVDNPDVIVTANAGCQLHLETQSKLVVKHWIEILDETLDYRQ